MQHEKLALNLSFVTSTTTTKTFRPNNERCCEEEECECVFDKACNLYCANAQTVWPFLASAHPHTQSFNEMPKENVNATHQRNAHRLCCAPRELLCCCCLFCFRSDYNSRTTPRTKATRKTVKRLVWANGKTDNGFGALSGACSALRRKSRPFRVFEVAIFKWARSISFVWHLIQALFSFMGDARVICAQQQTQQERRRRRKEKVQLVVVVAAISIERDSLISPYRFVGCIRCVCSLCVRH